MRAAQVHDIMNLCLKCELNRMWTNLIATQRREMLDPPCAGGHRHVHVGLHRGHDP
jgi:hypothetical protein